MPKWKLVGIRLFFAGILKLQEIFTFVLLKDFSISAVTRGILVSTEYTL